MTAPLAPALGRIAAPPSGGPWEAIRLELIDTLVMGHAAGQLDGAAWLAAWTAAVTAVRDRVIEEGRLRLERAATYSRHPREHLQGLIPDPAADERLLQRLLAEGIALEALERGGDDPRLDRQRGAALEAAWEGAVRVATAEAARLRGAADRVMAWRRPWRPLVIGAAIATILATGVAAVIAGIVPGPGWFQPVIDWFWELPWP